MDDRKALGFHGSTQSANNITPVTPVATDDRKIVPKFPGSDTASKIKYNMVLVVVFFVPSKRVDDDDDGNVYCGISQIATIP
jgi:hypothetical protein